MNHNSSQLILPGCAHWSRTSAETPMTVESSGIINGRIEDRFGKQGSSFHQGMPTYSLPLSIQNMPEGTRCFTLILADYDAIPVCGFAWIHWIAANIKFSELPENASEEYAVDLVQGVNSWASPLLKEKALPPEKASCYGGMVPPDRAHKYYLTVYALDQVLNLENGFYLNQMLDGMNGHILAAASLCGVYFAD